MRYFIKYITHFFATLYKHLRKCIIMVTGRELCRWAYSLQVCIVIVFVCLIKSR